MRFILSEFRLNCINCCNVYLLQIYILQTCHHSIGIIHVDIYLSKQWLSDACLCVFVHSFVCWCVWFLSIGLWFIWFELFRLAIVSISTYLMWRFDKPNSSAKTAIPLNFLRRKREKKNKRNETKDSTTKYDLSQIFYAFEWFLSLSFSPWNFVFSSFHSWQQTETYTNISSFRILPKSSYI